MTMKMTTFQRHALLALATLLLCWPLSTACDDGGEDPGDPDTSAADTTAGDATDDTAEPDTAEPDTAEPDTTDDVDDATDMVEDTAPDMVDAWTEPARFSLIYLNEDLREIVHLAGASSVVISQVQMSARSLTDAPIPGQTLAISNEDGPQARIQPMMPVTDDEGLTPVLELTLTGNTDVDLATHRFTPYIVPNTPDPLRNQVRINTSGIEATAIWPTDANGDPVPPVADGSSTWSVTWEFDRIDEENFNPMPENMSFGIEFITNQGTPPLAFADDPDATEMTWPIDRDNPSITVDFVSTGTEPRQARMFVRLYQLGDDHGDRLEMIDVVAPTP